MAPDITSALQPGNPLQNAPYSHSPSSIQSTHHQSYNPTSTSSVSKQPPSSVEDQWYGRKLSGRRGSAPGRSRYLATGINVLTLTTLVSARTPPQANRNHNPQLSSTVQSAHNTAKEANLPKKTKTNTNNHNHRFSEVRYSPTAGKTVLEIRKLAKSALLGLLPHSIRYADLLAAGVDENTLRSLYEEIGVKVPPKTSLMTTENHNNDINNNNNTRTSSVNSMGQNHSAALTTASDHNNRNRDYPAALVARPPPLPPPPPTSSSPKAAVSTQAGQDLVGHPENSFSFPAGAPPKRQEEVKSRNTSLSLPVPNVVTSKSISAVVKTSKPLERKDYIARLLAAKNATAKAPTVPTRSNQVPPLVKNSSNSTKDATAVSIDASVTKELPLSYHSLNGPKAMDPEAIKQAQTNLARQKIEALKKRNHTLAEQTLASRVELQAREPTTPVPAPDSSLSTAPTILPQAKQDVLPQSSASQPSQQAERIHNSRPQSPITPTTSQIDRVQVSAAPLSGIPGLFMTSAPLASPRSVASPSLAVLQQSTTTAISGINPRKRPLAADLNDLSTSTIKRPFGQTRHVEVVIDVSDDDSGDITDGSDMDVDDVEDGTTSRHSQTVTDISVTKSLHDPPLPRDTTRRKSVVATSAANTPSASQTPGKGKRPEDLRSREEEIQLMHEKIAELEQRRKSKQGTSRAQTPGTPGILIEASNPKATAAGEAKPPVSTEADSELPNGQVNHVPSAEELKAIEMANAEEEKAVERRALDQRALEQRALEQRALEQRALGQRALGQRALGQRALEQRAIDQRAIDQRA